MFDRYSRELSAIDSFVELERWMMSEDIEGKFLEYASREDNLRPVKGEWEESREYMLPQIFGLVGRYSKVGEEAFYRFYLPIDETIQTALTSTDL